MASALESPSTELSDEVGGPAAAEMDTADPVVAAVASAAADGREVVMATPEQSGKLGSVLISIVDKLDQLQRSVRAKKAVLHAAGVEGNPVATADNRPRPDFSRLPSYKVPSSVAPAAPQLSRFASVDTPAAREELGRLAAGAKETKFNFHALSRALTLAQGAEVLGAGLECSSDAAVQMDAEEVAHVRALLAEHKELSLQVLRLEEQQLAAQLDLLDSMDERAKAFSFEGEDLREMFRDAEEAREEAKKAGASSSSSDPVERKKGLLKREEAKLDQMRFMLQKLLFALPAEGIGEEDKERHHAMMVRCGEDVAKLQEAHLGEAGSQQQQAKK